MEEKQPLAYKALIGVSALCTLLAVITLLPGTGAVKPNILGYRSVCSFAPAATAVCALLAGICCTLRNRLVSRKASSMRYKPPILPIGLALILIAIAVASGLSHGAAQASFTRLVDAGSLSGMDFSAIRDGTRSATVDEGEISATIELVATGGKVVRLTLTRGENVTPELADAIFRAVIARQSTTVDAVSGATASSHVLIRAIEAAAIR